MRVGSILTLTGSRQAGQESSRAARRRAPSLNGSSYVHLDLLGDSLLHRAVEKLQSVSSLPVEVLSEGPNSNQVLSARGVKPNTFVSLWESTVSRFVKQHNVDLLLLVRLSNYNDLSYGDLIEFHLQRDASLTQVYAEDGAVDVGVVSASALRNSDQAYRRTLNTLVSRQERYSYDGYLNRLASPQHFQSLVQDALYRRCGLTPAGSETGEGVWIGKGAQIDSSAQVVGPAFIGEESRIAASCVISGASTVERNCEIDCGTTISQSCVLENTYVGVALDVRRSIVSNDKLFQLDRNVEVNIGDSRIIGSSSKAMPLLSNLSSLLFGEAGSGD